jgi:hypothetical protein
VVHDAHLYLLEFHAGSFGASWQVEMVLFFSEWRLGAFHGLGSRMLECFILIYALYSAHWEKKEKKKKRKDSV